MAIRIIEGVPGAGKTYFAVDHVLKEFYRWDDDIDRWVARDPSLVLITNIDNFQLGRQLDEEVAIAGSVEQFFNYEYLERRFEGVKVVILLDEVQGIFDSKFHNKAVFLYFQKHRHLGHDLYLVTQDAGHLAKGLRNLAEYHIRAGKRTMSILGEFRYSFVDPSTGQSWKTKMLRRDGKVFAVYRSMTGAEKEKLGSAPRLFMLAFVILVVIAVGGFTSFVKYRYFGSRSVEAGQVKKGGTVTKGSSSSVAPGSSNAFVPTVKQPVFPEETVEGELVGVAVLGEKTSYVVMVGGSSRRVDVDGLSRLCRCHGEELVVGAHFAVKVLTSRREAAREQSAAPARRWLPLVQR